jgi:HSP20 family protein
MSRYDFDWMREVQDLSSRLKNYFENFDRPVSPHAADTDTALAADLYFADGAYRADVEIPGMRKEDIVISMAGNAVEISGDKRPSRSEGVQMVYGGRHYGSFRKRIELPRDADVDVQKVTASYENGVLRITLPKREKDPGISIPIA